MAMSTNASHSPCDQSNCGCGSPLTRRDFIRWTTTAAATATATATVARWPAVAGPFAAGDFDRLIPADKKLDPAWVKSLRERGQPTAYRDAELEKIGMPVGGICAGQLYLGGDGRLWHWDLFNLPQPANFSDTGGPNYARPPKPASPIEQGFAIRTTAEGQSQTRVLDSRGFDPRHIAFRGEYPIGFVNYHDPTFPVRIRLEAFSPFIPLNVEDSSLPATVLHFTVTNQRATPVTVELGGWLENAVCLGSGRAGLGQRQNRILRDAGLLQVHGTAGALPAAHRPTARPEIVFETFEQGYGAWQIEGDAFGAEPAAGTLAGQQNVSGFSGQRLINTFRHGDASQGRLLSPAFTIERRFIAFLIGGGSHAGRTCLNLVLDGTVARTATGHNDERLDWQEWDVTDFEGRTARLEIVDQATEGWGHINVDQIVFTDEPPSTRTPLEARDDFGSLSLALLGEGGLDFAQTRLAIDPAEALFAPANPPDAAESVVPFGRPLIGALGRTLTLAPGQAGEVTFAITWFFPGLMRRTLGPLEDLANLKRAYARRFGSAADVARYLANHFDRLAGQTRLWNRTWYDSTLPYWFLDRTFAPICTLATNTCFQFDSGRFYAFEGVYCCQGTCQHVWNYAQSVARIFPALERDLRERTDFGTAWHPNGATDYRGECARQVAHDGQCGVILRAWREHQMSPDAGYLRATWPRIRQSIDYLIALDKEEDGLLEGEQYNTLDASWFGPMAWISSFYVAALRAGEAMARENGDEAFAARCRRIAERGSEQLVKRLYNGEYFIHQTDPQHPQATNTNDGCHIDQLMGQAWALQVGLPRIVPLGEARSALEAVWKYNFTPDVGPFRRGSPIKGGRWYALAGEGGVIMTTFPRGGVERAVGQGGFGYYFNEVWTGQEHQLAAHLIWEDMVDQGLVITRILHDRHHAARRNPYNEVECSDHYTRAMSSHGTFLAACGFEIHGPQGHLGFAPRLSPEHFRAPFTAAEGWGTFEQRREGAAQTASIALRYGRLRLQTLALAVAESASFSRAQARLNGTPVTTSAQTTKARALVRFAPELKMAAGDVLSLTLS
jgi:uncharacterized protein (DUF608 family)